MKGLTIWLWFDTEAEEAARFYTSVFVDGTIHQIARYPDAGQQITGKDAGSVMTVLFEINGTQFAALNGGSAVTKNEGVSLAVNCETQAEIDYYWEQLGAGGPDEAKVCGWLKDQYGLSWQIVPTILDEMTVERDPEAAARMFEVMLKMKKMNIAALQAAWDGNRG